MNGSLLPQIVLGAPGGGAVETRPAVGVADNRAIRDGPKASPAPVGLLLGVVPFTLPVAAG